MILALVLSLLTNTQHSFAGDVLVAVASNFNPSMEQISAQFNKRSGHNLIISAGASGKFYTQIKNDAPFEVFLSADQVHPNKLIQENLAIKETQFTYAVGKLVLWSANSNLVDPSGEVLRKRKFKVLAIANPKIAPYGLAAQETLIKFGQWEQLQSQLVFGENITQTYQFAASGNAELGFIAYSQIHKPNKKIEGSFWAVPQKLYTPIKQDAVLLQKGKKNQAAKEFLTFLKSDEAKNIIREYGYDL